MHVQDSDKGFIQQTKNGSWVSEANEAIDEVKKKKKSCLFFKVDFENARVRFC